MTGQQDMKIDYVEFPTAEMTTMKTFYTEVFGWEFTDYGPDYASFGFRGQGKEQNYMHEPLYVTYLLGDHSDDTSNLLSPTNWPWCEIFRPQKLFSLETTSATPATTITTTTCCDLIPMKYCTWD